MYTRSLWLCLLLLLVCGIASAQDVKPVVSTFDDYFQEKDSKSNLSMLKSFLDSKDDERQEILNEIDDINSRVKTLNIDTTTTYRVENAIQSTLANSPSNNGIFTAKELRPGIIAMATRFGRGTYPSKSSQDTSLQYNLKFLLEDIRGIETAYKSAMADLSTLDHNLKIVNTDRQKAENLIQSIYTVEKGNIEFKTRVSLYFSGIIMVLLIIFFLFIYLKSEHGVANEFLSGNGIQFVALFSLIIAIVLFGILGVLEGRELAAILSGISGFILGKGLTKPESKPLATPPVQSVTMTPPDAPVVVKNEEPSAN